MINILFSDPAAWQRLHTGPLSPHIDFFAEHLLVQGYAAWTVVDKLRVATKLSHWLTDHGLGVEALDEQQIDAFLCDLHEREQRRY